MTNATDHLAAYRSKQTLSIHEAACLIENTSPNMRFARRDPPVEERHLVAKIEDWKRALREAAQAGNPLLGIAIQYESVFVPNRRDSSFVTNFATEQRPTGTYKKSEAWARTTVERPNLIAWLDSIGHRPAFFFPGEQGRALDGPAMRGHENESDLLRVLIRASANFWKPADRQEKDTHPTNKDVAKWLERNGFTPSLAKHAASIIRPNWAATGRPTEK